MQSEAGSQARAWVEYFRDMGVYDFYRRGDPAPPCAIEIEAGADAATQRATDAADFNDPPTSPTEATAARRGLDDVAAAPAPNLSSTIVERTSVPPAKLISFDDLAPLPAAAVPAAEREAALRAIQQEIGDCTRCPLAYAGRHKIVFGDGLAAARLMFVGEGPGADEDTQGIPFVGKAGQLLNNMIGAMGLSRAEVYIANIVKCRPPNNRVPEPVEANTCSQFLLRQIDVVRPEAIVALGATAATYLLGVKQPLSSLRGRWHGCRGAKLAVTYHPAFLLRDPRQKAEAWKDLQMVMAELGLTPPARK